MVKQVYAIQDVKISVFFQPMVLLNDNEARRIFSDLVSDPQTTIAKHPEDFRLFKLGEYDDNSGVLSPMAQPEFLINGIDFIAKK